MSPKDIIVAKPRDLDDHIEWLVERRKYSDALKAAEKAGASYGGRLQVKNIIEIGQKYLATLLEEGHYEEAAALCPKILRKDGKMWEKWIFAFSEAKHVKAIRPYIPLEEVEISSAVYEMVLIYLLSGDQE
ncbi:Vacuolar protein sorting-associated protein 41, partial [Nowakowskiella sp. JEL0078]